MLSPGPGILGPADIRVGTSGWHYAHWKGPFYPEKMSSGDFLAFYSERFRTVEINNSFYRLPEARTFREWRDATPDGFLFSVKASRYITHMKKLKDPGGPVRKFLRRAEALGGKLGPVLFQLPPRWTRDPERLDSFLGTLPEGIRGAFEFRDPTWFVPEVYRILEDHGAAFCIYDLDGSVSPEEVTADFVYVRLHGPVGKYGGSYTPRKLSEWAGAISAWARQGKDVYCYFDNDAQGYAVLNAAKLREMLG